MAKPLFFPLSRTEEEEDGELLAGNSNAVPAQNNLREFLTSALLTAAGNVALRREARSRVPPGITPHFAGARNEEGTSAAAEEADSKATLS